MGWAALILRLSGSMGWDCRMGAVYFRFWLQAAVRRAAISVCFTPSFGHSGSGVARHAILATNAANVRFLPIASAVHPRAEAPGVIVDGRF